MRHCVSIGPQKKAAKFWTGKYTGDILQCNMHYYVSMTKEHSNKDEVRTVHCTYCSNQTTVSYKMKLKMTNALLRQISQPKKCGRFLTLTLKTNRIVPHYHPHHTHTHTQLKRIKALAVISNPSVYRFNTKICIKIFAVFSEHAAHFRVKMSAAFRKADISMQFTSQIYSLKGFPKTTEILF